MERMLPIDLERAPLKRAFRGYDRAQVDALVGNASLEMQRLLAELKSAEATIARQRSEIDAFRAQESTLKEALMLAQRTADETRASAHREADLILDEARRRGADLERQANDEVANLRWELEKLRQERNKFERDFRHLLESYLRDLAERAAPIETASDKPVVAEAAAGE